MSDPAYERYVRINLPHARTVLQRIGRCCDRLGVFDDEGGNGGPPAIEKSYDAVEVILRPHDDDPPFERALAVADEVAVAARTLAGAVIERKLRDERLGQAVRNLFECLGLPEEGADLGLQCGESPDSLLR